MTIGKEDFSEAINECVLRWPPLAKQVGIYYSHLNFIRLDAFENICHRFVEDFRSMPLPKDFKEAYSEWRKKNYTKEPRTKSMEDFIIEYERNCGSCEKRNVMCIQEPIGAGWECRQCYTGLTGEQIIERYGDLVKVMDQDSDFIPDWYKRDEVPF